MLTNKRILITNDDGINAEGIKALVREIYKYTKDIVVLAPAKQKSAVSHARTIFTGMSLEKIENYECNVEAYAFDGTPGDCVRFADFYFEKPFDYVISGMNNGYNIGEDILFSGTCAAGFEANLLGIKSICFSTDVDHFELSIYIKDALKYIEENNYQFLDIINVNIPKGPKGIKFVPQSLLPIFDSWFEQRDGLWYLCGNRKDYKDNEEVSDVVMVAKGFITITPLTIKRSNI